MMMMKKREKNIEAKNEKSKSICEAGKKEINQTTRKKTKFFCRKMELNVCNNHAQNVLAFNWAGELSDADKLDAAIYRFVSRFFFVFF